MTTKYDTKTQSKRTNEIGYPKNIGQLISSYLEGQNYEVKMDTKFPPSYDRGSAIIAATVHIDCRFPEARLSNEPHNNSFVYL